MYVFLINIFCIYESLLQGLSIYSDLSRYVVPEKRLSRFQINLKDRFPRRLHFTLKSIGFTMLEKLLKCYKIYGYSDHIGCWFLVLFANLKEFAPVVLHVQFGHNWHSIFLEVV